MRKSLLNYGMLAVAAMAFVGCTEKEFSPEVTPVTYTMTINLGKAIDSKTAVIEGETEASYVWTEGDDAYFHVYESTFDAKGTESKTEGTINEVIYSEDKTTASLNVSFTSSATGPYTYRVVYANTVSSSKNPLIPAEQSPKANSYDPAADVLVSRPIESETRVESVEMTMGRAATINKMTLKGLAAGEKVSKVTFTTDKSLSAYYAISTKNYSANAKTLTFSYDNVEVGSDGTFPVYFVSAPVDGAAIESVVVTTDKNVYTKSSSLDPNPFDGKTITFAVGTMKRFGMDMVGYGEPISSAVEFLKVTSLADLGDEQDVIIVGKKDATYFTMANQGDNNRPAVEITSMVNEAGAEVALDNTSTAHIFTLTKTELGYIFYDKDATSGYLYAAGTATSKKNYLRSTTTLGDSCYWDIVYDESGKVTIKSVNNDKTPYMQYNATNKLFSCYNTESQDEVILYVDVMSLIPSLKTPSGLDAISEGNTVTIAWDPVENAESYDVTCAGQTKNVSTNSATFTDVAEGTYEVSVIAVSNDQSVIKNSEAATTSVVVGTPTLDKPVIKSFSETATGFTVELEKAIDYATSYDWYLYEGAVDEANCVGLGTSASANFTTTFNESEFDITEFAPETTYYLEITVKADGYTSSTSDAASFTTAAASQTIKTVTYTVTSISAVSVSGEAPSGSTATYSSTYGSKAQLTGGNSMTLTLSGYKGMIVKGLTLSMRSNSSGGAGYLSVKAGDTTLGSIASSSSGVKFNTSSWYGDWSTSYVDVKPTLSNTAYTIQTGENLVIVIGATANSLYCESFTIEYVADPSFVGGSDPVKLAAPAVSCTAKTETSLTFSWAAVDNASGYQVSTDGGSTYDDTQTATTYTWKGLTAGTTKTLYVKAIGDGTNYTDSDAGSAEGTTTAADANDGSLAKPFTAAEAITAIDAGKDLTNKYVKGVITEVTSFNATYGSITYNIKSGEKTLMVYSGLDLGKAQFSSIADLKINDEVLVCGTLKKFNSTYEFDKNNYLVTLNGLSEINAGLKVSGQKTIFTVGDKFEFGGTVVQDWRGKDDVDVTSSAKFSGYDMNTAGKQTVTVTVGEESTTYEITVMPAGLKTVTLQYSKTTTTNMTGNNDAATVGLNAEEWSVVGSKGCGSNFPGLNKSKYIAIYYNATESASITVSTSKYTIHSIKITYTSKDYNKGKVLVGGNEVTVLNGTYSINGNSFVVTNGNTSSTQVRISSIEITYE